MRRFPGPKHTSARLRSDVSCGVEPLPTAAPGGDAASSELWVSCHTDGSSEETWFVREGDSRVPLARHDPRASGAIEQALASCSTTGAQAVAILYVTWADPTGQMATIEDVDAAVFGAEPSLRDYWEEASYGVATATGGVFGPYVLDRAYTCSPGDLSALEAAAMAAADPDVDFTQYSRVVVVSPQGPDSGCTILGTSQLGCSTKSTAGDGSFTASLTFILDCYMVPQDRGASLMAHELGHALGLGHANSLDFDLDALPPVGKASFGVSTEYGGVYTAMASSSLHHGHYGAPHKARLGWLDGRYATIEASGTYHLAPYAEDAVEAVQALRVRRAPGVDEWLWLEQRTPSGPYDSTLDPLAFTGPLVHLQSSATDTKAYAVDLTPATGSYRDGVLAAAFAGFVPKQTGTHTVYSVASYPAGYMTASALVSFVVGN